MDKSSEKRIREIMESAIDGVLNAVDDIIEAEKEKSFEQGYEDGLEAAKDD